MGRVAAAFLAAISLVSTVVLYQNCGKAGFEDVQSLEEASQLHVDPKFSGLPFPYEISVNQIAHMSCPMNSRGTADLQSPYFSWRMAAYDNPPDVLSSTLGIRSAGLKLSEEFRTQWSKVASTFPAALQKEKLEEALKTLPTVRDVRLLMSFRKTSTPATSLMALPTGADSPVGYFLSPLSDNSFVARYSQNMAGQYNTFPEVVEAANRYLDTRLTIPSSLGTNEAALRANYDASFLTLGFAQEDKVELLGPGDDRFAYGKGFRVRFGVANPHIGTNIYPNADSLAAVEEYDLMTGNRSPGVAWDCSYRFKIVRSADRYKTFYKTNHFQLINGQCPVAPQTGDFCASSIDPRFGIPLSVFGASCPANRTLVRNTTLCPEQYHAVCPHEPYTANTSDPRPIMREDGVYHPNYPNRPAILHALRRFLPADKWDINVSRGCIVPKSEDNTCYQSEKVVYDETFFTEGMANPNLGMYAGCGVAGQFPCAAYITMCIRK